MLKKGFLLPSFAEKKKSHSCSNSSSSAVAGCEKKNSSTTLSASSSGGGGGEKNNSSSRRLYDSSAGGGASERKRMQDLNGYEWKMIPEGFLADLPVLERDATINFTHLPCLTEITRRVNKDSMLRGSVIVRCNGCQRLVPVAGNFHEMMVNLGHDKVERNLLRYFAPELPPKGSNVSMCTTYIPTDFLNIKNAKGESRGMTITRPERDHEVAYTHRTCKTKMVRKVSREAFVRGAVMTRCNGCNQLCGVADYFGLFGRLAHQSTLEGVLTQFLANLNRGMEDTFCVTRETLDYFSNYKSQNQGLKEVY